jgi:Flp pilus assembly pilin Flp
MNCINVGLRLFYKAVHRLVRDDSGQDMIEYALLSAALVVVVAGFLPPQLVPAITTIFSKIAETLSAS